MTQPTVIVIVTPAFNAVETIERTIVSVITQAGDFDLIYHVQDGGSNDNTLEVLGRWETLIAEKTLPLFCRSLTFSFASAKDRGLYDAIAKGFGKFKVSDDAWLGWINADDLLLPGTCALLSLIDATPSQRHMKWIGGTSGVVKDDVVIASEARALSSPVIREGICEGQHWGFVQQEGVFFRQIVWRNIDVRKEFTRFKYAGDWNLWRCMAKKYRFYQVDRPLGLFRVRAGQISQERRVEYNAEIDAVLPAGRRLAALRVLASAPPERLVLTHAWPTGALGFRTEKLAVPAAYWLEHRIGPRHNADWQFPAVTEQHAAERIWQSIPVSNDTIYFCFPWATLIDQLHNKVDASELMAVLRAASARKRSAGRVVTVCQHIRMLQYRELFDIADITEIYWSHTAKGMRTWPGNRSIVLNPFPLYPVQVPTSAPANYDERREHLFSFVGAAANTWYLSEVRSWILRNLSDDPRGVTIGRNEWHYEKVVYNHQIRKTATAPEVLIDTSASEEFRELLSKSTFALCPSGSGPNSIRLWEAIGAGAIPVIIADSYAPPGDIRLWQEAAVFCPEDEASVCALPDQLQTIAADAGLLARKRAGLRQLWALYGPDNFISDIRLDAFRSASLSLAKVAGRRDRDDQSPRPVLKVGFIGRHASRTPLGYAAYRAFFSEHVEIVKTLEHAQIIVSGFEIDFRENIETLARIRDKNPAVKFLIISEEPLWDTVWASAFRENRIRITEKGTTLDYIAVNHANSELFHFDAIPYFLTTEDKYLARYSHYFSRNAQRAPETVVEHWRTASTTAAFYCEKRLDPRYGRSFPEDGVTGLSLFRSELAAAVDMPGVVRVGLGWTEAVKRQALPDWHLDKLASLDQQAFIVSAIENTHQKWYVTEKLFDAFSVGGLPLYYAANDHAIHRIVKGGFINLHGMSPDASADAVRRLIPGLEHAKAWCAAQSDLAGLLSDPGLLARERRRLAGRLTDLMRDIVQEKWPVAAPGSKVEPAVPAPPPAAPPPRVVHESPAAADRVPQSGSPRHRQRVLSVEPRYGDSFRLSRSYGYVGRLSNEEVDAHHIAIPVSKEARNPFSDAFDRAAAVLGIPRFREQGTIWVAEGDVLRNCLAKEIAVVHFVGGDFTTWSLPGLPASLFGHKQRPATVLSVRNSVADLRRSADIDRLRNFDGIIVHSAERQSFIQNSIGHRRVFLVPHGVDTGFFHPRPHGSERSGVFQLLLVGESHYNDDTITAALEAVRAGGMKAELTIMAPGPSGSRAATTIDTREGLSAEALRQAYWNADLVVFPVCDAVADSAVLEAMACGRAVVTTAVGGVVETMGNDAGLVCPVGDLRGLAEAISLLAKHPERRETMGRNGRTRAEHHDWRAIAELYRATYRAVIEGQRSVADQAAVAPRQ